MNEKKIRNLEYYLLGKSLNEKNKDRAEEYISILNYLKKYSGVEIMDIGNVGELLCNNIKYKKVDGRKIPDVDSFIEVEDCFDDWNNRVLYSFDIEFTNKENGHKETISFCTNDEDSSYLYGEGYNVVQINPSFRSFTWKSDEFSFKDPEIAGDMVFRFRGLLSEKTADPICDDSEFSLIPVNSADDISKVIEYKAEGTMEGTGVYPDYFSNLNPSDYMSYKLRNYPEVHAMILSPYLDDDEDDYYGDYYDY